MGNRSWPQAPFVSVRGERAEPPLFRSERQKFFFWKRNSRCEGEQSWAATAVTIPRMDTELPRLTGSRYVVPLREGGSLPAVVDTDADGTFVVKFRAAGQGPKALIAEVLVALIAQQLQLPVPRPAVVELEDGFGRGEPDPEIQDILRGS